jgi:hypothetical protein
MKKQLDNNKTICHNFWLRKNYLAQVVIPFDLNNDEANMLCKFIKSLAIPSKFGIEVNTEKERIRNAD